MKVMVNIGDGFIYLFLLFDLKKKKNWKLK